MTSGIQDRILGNAHFFEWLLDVYQVTKQTENKRKILQFLTTVMINFDHRQLKFDRLSEILTNTVGTHKLSLLFSGHSLLMLSIRALIIMNQKRLYSIGSDDRSESGLSVNLNPASLSHIQRF